MTVSPAAPCGPVLDPPQEVCIFLEVVSPVLSKGEGYLLWPAGNALSNAGQDIVGLFMAQGCTAGSWCAYCPNSSSTQSFLPHVLFPVYADIWGYSSLDAEFCICSYWTSCGFSCPSSLLHSSPLSRLSMRTLGSTSSSSNPGIHH